MAAALSPVQRNQWVPDSARSQCVACSKSFGLFQRRHHCRYCGDIFCNRCSPPTRLGQNSAHRCCPACRDRGSDVRRRRETTPAVPVSSSPSRVEVHPRYRSTTERPRPYPPQAQSFGLPPIRPTAPRSTAPPTEQLIAAEPPVASVAQLPIVSRWTCLACTTSNAGDIQVCSGCSLPPSVSHSISSGESLSTTARLRAQTTLRTSSPSSSQSAPTIHQQLAASTSSSALFPTSSSSTSLSGSTIQVKCHLGDDKRIFRLDHPIVYSGLMAKVEETFGQPVKMTYRDADGDLITIASQADLDSIAVDNRLDLFLSPWTISVPAVAASAPPSCSICFDRPPNAIFLPCAHLGACLECSSALRQCPFCRQAIERIQQVYAV